ncbi:MAG: ABC transporter substrate-binding protein [Planctomycetota bacterium]|nr:ABC transporter substrate-binding protein [Planctomycetota bacterium]
MRDNPVLALLKVVGIFMLVGVVGLSFWQNTKWEDRMERLGTRISGLEAVIDRQEGTISKLDRTIRKGKFVQGGSGGGTAPTGEDVVPEPDQMEAIAWNDEPPKWMKGRAAKLWGSYGKNYLQPDPNWPEYPSLDDPRVDPDGKLTLWYGSAPADLNPLTLSDGSVSRYIRVYCDEYLAAPHSQDPYKYKPSMAYRVEVSPDYKTWIFWLRPGVRWHTPQVDLNKYPHLKGENFMTAHDWKFTFDLVLDGDVRAAHLRSYLKDLDRPEVVDDHCFILHWNKSSFTSIGANLNLVAALPEFIYGYDENGDAFDPATRASQFNEHWFGRDFHWVGTGPYYLASYDPETRMVVRRNDDYWGQLPTVKIIEREMFPARELSYTKFEGGAFAYASYLAPDFTKRIENREEFKSGKWAVHWAWSTGYPFIAYKNTHPFFRDVKVRTAMTYACNRQRMLDVTQAGKGKIVTGPQSMHAPTYPKDLEPLPYDLEKARALLAEAGWTDADGNGVLEREVDGEVREFRVKAMIPTTTFFKSLFEVFREDLAKVGVRLELEPLQWGQFSKRLSDRNFDITALFWDTTGWDSSMAQIWHSDQIEDPESSNFIEFSDPEVDRLIDEARYTFDLEKRVEIQSAAHKRIASLQPYTFLFTVQSAFVYDTTKLSDPSKADRWKSRPFIRLFPLYVPRAK